MWVRPGHLGLLAADVGRAPLRRALQRVERARAEVAVDVAAAELGERGAGVDDPAGHGAALGVRVLGDGPDELAGLVELVALDAVGALEGAPAEVLRRLVGLEQHAVDLLHLVLADVADPQLAERGVEGEAPGVAQAGQDDVPARLRLPDVGGEDLAELVPRGPGPCGSGRRRRRRRRARGRGARRGRTGAGRRCGSPRAGRRRAARAAARGSACRPCGPRTPPRACRPSGPTSAGRRGGPSRSRGGRRSRAGPARRRAGAGRRGRARPCGACRRGG